MTTVIFSIFFGIGWVFAILGAINDFRILVHGKIEEDTNMTGIPTEELTGIATRLGFVRLIAALRLVFAIAWIIAVPMLAIRAWWGEP
ncbi:hypothetical protein [Rubripirellula reticaptiva]|nr:hypothetical protein [Rubripirellula reticaptiva]TWU51439.1 hypothetical protein Poly59_30310 [Rubripirellula reticaptiva]